MDTEGKNISLEDLEDYYLNNGGLKKYVGYVNSINGLILSKSNNNESVLDWLEEAFKTNSSIETLTNKIEKLYLEEQLPWKESTKEDYKFGFEKFAQTICGLFNAKIWLNNSNYDNLFCELIAKNAIFADKEVVEAVKKGELGTDNNKNLSNNAPYSNPYASWDFMEHYRDNGRAKKSKEERTVSENEESFLNEFKNIVSEKAYNFLKSKVADDNSCANRYIKQAVLASITRKFGKNTFKTDYFKGYEACHIWDNPGDRRYYASIANLILVPRGLAQLTDHNDAVKALLRNKVKVEFGLEPPKGRENELTSVNLDKYKDMWRKVYE